MLHPNLKSEYPVSPTLGGQAGFLMDFINLPSPPQSEAPQGTAIDEPQTTSGDALDAPEHRANRVPALPTPAPQPEAANGIPPIVKLAQGAVLAERASIFGSTVVRGRGSVESLRKRLARPPSLSCLPEDGTRSNRPEIEILEMSGDNGNEKYAPTGMVIPELFSILEVLDKTELRDVAARLNDECGEAEEPTAEISNVEKIKNVVRKRGFEITGFILGEKDNKIGLSLLKKESLGALNSIPSSPPPLVGASSEVPPNSEQSPSGVLATIIKEKKKLLGPRIRNSVTMSNLRAAARENDVSTPLYPSIKRTLRPSASNGTLLQARPTIRAVQPSPVVSETPNQLSPRKDTDLMMHSTPTTKTGSPTRNNRSNKLTKENLLLQEQLGALGLGGRSEGDVDIQRTKALDRILQPGKDLLRRVEKDNAKYRTQLARRAITPGITGSKGASSDKNLEQDIPKLIGGDAIEHMEEDAPDGFFRANSVAVSRSQDLTASAGESSRTGPTSRRKLLTSYEKNPTVPLERSHRVYPPSDPRSLYASPRRQNHASNQNLRPTSSMANVRADSKEAARRPASRSSAQPGLSHYRSFPTLHAVANPIASREAEARTVAETSRKNGVLSRPTTAQSNKQKQPPITAKKPAGGYGRDIKWA